MVDSPRVPGYPPPRNTWQFSRHGPSSGSRWLRVLAALAALLLAAAAIVLLARAEGEDRAGTIDDDRLTDTISAQCDLMTRTVASLPLTGSTQRQAAAVTDQDRAVQVMVRAIRRSHPDAIASDRPAERWLRDWDRLVAAREAYARELVRDPRATLVVPVDARGVEITARMDEVFTDDDVCVVPEALVRPYTDSFSGA